MSEAFEEQLEVHGKSFLFAWSELHPPEEESGFRLRAASRSALKAVQRARGGAPRPCPLVWAESELSIGALRKARERLEEGEAESVSSPWRDRTEKRNGGEKALSKTPGSPTVAGPGA